MISSLLKDAMDLSNADLIGVESIEMHSTLIIKESQLDGLKDISFLFSENEHSTLAIIDRSAWRWRDQHIFTTCS